jgi:hypothetical protein
MKHAKSFFESFRNLFPLFLMSCLFACKKDVRQITKDEPEPLSIAPSTTTPTNGTSCYDYTALIPQSDGTLEGWIENVPIRISGVIYQAYDNYGNPITFQQGDPFWGQINITSSTPAEVLYNSASPQDDQFTIRVYQMGGTFVDVAQYIHDRDAYIAAHSNQNSGIASYLYDPSMPKLSDYIKTGPVGTYHDITGRLIRINPQQIQNGTDALGNPIYVTTSFAWAPTCYPRPGIRPGTTTASVSLRNAQGCTVPSSVDFIRDGMVYRSMNFPITTGTTASPVSIPSGTYSLTFHIPAGYPFLTFTLGPNYWESNDPSGSARDFTIPGTVTLAAGTSYILIESTIAP